MNRAGVPVVRRLLERRYPLITEMLHVTITKMHSDFGRLGQRLLAIHICSARLTCIYFELRASRKLGLVSIAFDFEL